MVVQLNSKTIQVDGLMDTNPYMQTYEIRAASHASIGVNVYPRQFTELPDRYTRPDNFGPLEGAGDDGHLLWYLYTSENPQDSRLGALLPKGVSQGTIEIPSITINGQRYEPQKLTFKRESFVGVAAVNC